VGIGPKNKKYMLKILNKTLSNFEFQSHVWMHQKYSIAMLATIKFKLNKTVTTMQRTLCTKTTTATPTGINNLHLSQVELNLSLAGNLL
jgi:hypothetical protein